MKSLKSLLLILVLAFIAMPAFAQVTSTVNPCEDLAEATRGKSQMEVSTILEACRKTTEVAPAVVEAVSKVEVPDVAEVSEWASASKGFAEALGIAAKELGIAVNDFLNSPAGILLALILLYNFAGGALLGLPFTMFTLWLFTRVLTFLRTDKVEFENVPVFWGAFTIRRKTRITCQTLRENEGITLVLTGIGLLILNIVVWVNL